MSGLGGFNGVKTGEAAQLLGVAPSTVRRWIADGHIQAHRTLGGQYLIPWSEIERLRPTPSDQRAGKALLFARVPDGHDDLLPQAVTHLLEYATGKGYTVIGVISFAGDGEGSKELSNLRRRIANNPDFEVLVVEGVDRLSPTGGQEFVRWAETVGDVRVEIAGPHCNEARRVYGMETAMGLWALADTLALTGRDRETVEAIISRALSDIANFIEIR